jgi:hypothetical protein
MSQPVYYKTTKRGEYLVLLEITEVDYKLIQETDRKKTNNILLQSGEIIECKTLLCFGMIDFLIKNYPKLSNAIEKLLELDERKSNDVFAITGAKKKSEVYPNWNVKPNEDVLLHKEVPYAVATVLGTLQNRRQNIHEEWKGFAIVKLNQKQFENYNNIVK